MQNVVKTFDNDTDIWHFMLLIILTILTLMLYQMSKTSDQ